MIQEQEWGERFQTLPLRGRGRQPEGLSWLREDVLFADARGRGALKIRG